MLAPTMPPIGRDIGEKLARLARSQGLTQGQVAVKAHLSQPTISALFGGSIKDPPISTVLQTARALGVTIDQILGLSPMPEAPTPPTDDARERVIRLEDRFERVLTALAKDNRAVAEALLQSENTGLPKPAVVARRSSAGRKAK